MTVAVLGAGAFGTALAIALARTGPVTLWARDPSAVRDMRSARVNATRLTGVPLPGTIQVTADINDALTCSTLLLATPMQRLRDLLESRIPCRSSARLVACCKGIELTTGLGPIDVIAARAPDAVPALLTGPSFARDIATGLPTALTLACADTAAGVALQTQLSTDSLRLYRSTDTVGASLGGALKNVMAIACGAVIGAGLGESARAALLTRGFAEMQRVALARGAKAETLAGLSGFGDLVLTCTSDQSRNYQLGLSLGAGKPFDPRITVEGAATARALAGEATDRALDLPITTAVAALVENRISVADAVGRLLARPLKEE